MVRKRGVGVHRCRTSSDGLIPHSTRLAARALLAAVAAPLGCSGSVASGPVGGRTSGRPTAPAALEKPGARDANLAGARCKGGAPCTCRNRIGASAEVPPPDEQHKRFEIRLAGIGGRATLDSPTLGHFASAGDEVCFTIDVLPGTTSDVVFTATEAQKEGGHRAAARHRRVRTERAVLVRRHERPLRRSERQVQPRRRRRVERRGEGPQARARRPVWIAVISRLVWDTSGGVGNRELGLFKDITVKFTLEVKRFPTQWPPPLEGVRGEVKVHLIGIGGTGMGRSRACSRPPATTCAAPTSTSTRRCRRSSRTWRSRDSRASGPRTSTGAPDARRRRQRPRQGSRRGGRGAGARHHARVVPGAVREAVPRRPAAPRRSVVVAGTHGKTTTSSLLAHVLPDAGRDPSFLIGGVPLNFRPSWRLGAGAEFVDRGRRVRHRVLRQGIEVPPLPAAGRAAHVRRVRSRRHLSPTRRRCAPRSASWSR